jgi:hypothetical protein
MLSIVLEVLALQWWIALKQEVLRVPPILVFCVALLALPTEALKDIVCRFIIEYSSLRDFCP